MHRINIHSLLSKHWLNALLLLIAFSLLPAPYPLPPAFAVPTHLDRSKVPQGCGACHKGHGQRGTLMLNSPEVSLCFKCHGFSRKGTPGESLTDIYSVINKPSNHPVIDTAGYHMPGETLPEKNPATPRHVSCYDCHNPHESTKGKPFKGINGYSGKGARSRHGAEKEYEVCYLCHSDSANLPSGETNIALDFDTSNPSYHPVENYGKGKSVPSLLRQYNTSSIITCSDCHGNDDPSGPKGPHGSIYSPILRDRYDIQPVAESPSAYRLCYSCHDRNSILGDESFKAHKRHIVYSETPCIACHDAHGSRIYPALIRFDDRLVTPNSMGELTYMPFIPGKPRCFLSCHVNGVNYEHRLTNGQYCINADCSPGW
ncbi:cytochrome c nitrite reductase pentaheme subunit [bacterium BMS3Abin07]|nr:cytochrome c nitrite reductase pentaheme subunit [bacterium BMS3Abin07]GBE32192.1 cytochrome c nitrite reductase pentaheme subunit [bacterium BMS3Bbin05]